MNRIIASLSALLIVAVIIVVVPPALSQVAGTTPKTYCGQWHHGMDPEEIPAQFGLPYSVFFSNRNEQASYAEPPTFINVLCEYELDTHTLEVGYQTAAEVFAVYRYAYQWKNGAWQKLTLQGHPLRGNKDWLSRLGKATIERTSEALSKQNYIIAFVCEGVKGTWKCGCRDTACASQHWQLQAFSLKKG